MCVGRRLNHTSVYDIMINWIWTLHSLSLTNYKIALTKLRTPT